MPCEGSSLSCQLERIADSLQGFDAAGFLATLFATALGAGLAFAGALLVYRRQRRDEVAVRLNAALSLVVQKLVEDIGAIETYNGELAEAEYEGFNGDWDGLEQSLWVKHRPNLTATRGLISAAELETSTPHQRAAVIAIFDMVLVADSAPPAQKLEILEEILSVIPRWRAGEIPEASLPSTASAAARKLEDRYGSMFRVTLRGS